jgi:hypothetical protein
MKTIKQIEEEVKNLEWELVSKNIFNGAGTVTIKETGEMISTNGALSNLEDLLIENGYRFSTHLN